MSYINIRPVFFFLSSIPTSYTPPPHGSTGRIPSFINCSNAWHVIIHRCSFPLRCAIDGMGFPPQSGACSLLGEETTVRKRTFGREQLLSDDRRKWGLRKNVRMATSFNPAYYDFACSYLMFHVKNTCFVKTLSTQKNFVTVMKHNFGFHAVNKFFGWPQLRRF